MIMPRRLRTFALTVHVTCSVGWIGAVLVFLALAIVGLTSEDPQTVRGAYIVMEPAAWSVLVPLAFASLITGTVQGLGTVWGLFRHYWVLFKLLITGFATIVLLIYMETFRVMASVAADPTADLAIVRSPSPRFHATLALLVLLVATILAVYKPTGITPYGRRKLRERAEARSERPADVSQAGNEANLSPASTTRVRRLTLYLLLGVAALLLLFVAWHIAAGGLAHH